ncbi:MAG: DHH family phosphoesterase [Candidatus Falkowbacteria bacterium]
MLNIYQQCQSRLSQAEHILIIINQYWQPDAIASALALSLYLAQLGKTATIIAPVASPSTALQFLPGWDTIQIGLNNWQQYTITLATNNGQQINQVEQKQTAAGLQFIIEPKIGTFTQADVSFKPATPKYDIIVAIDSRDLDSFGTLYDDNTDLFYQVPVVNIDHHPGNEQYGQINLIELTAASSSQIIYDLLHGWDEQYITEDVATCLLAGIIAKTRSFKTSYISPSALTMVANLINKGGRRDEIINRLYRSRDLTVLKLWGVVLARLKSSADNSLVWSLVSQEDFNKTKTNIEDLVEVVDELIINIPQAKVIILFYEQNNNGQTTSAAKIFALKTMSAINLTQELHGVGTKQSAEVISKESLPVFEQRIITHLLQKISDLPNVN